MPVIACSFDGGPWDGREIAVSDPGDVIRLMKDESGRTDRFTTDPDLVLPQTETVGTYQRYGVSRTYLWRGWGDGSC